ncbi:MAG: hypothetical protein OEZ48_12450 [Candidatus Bathyarchaeota archaeon]|nr:hypothetical protein [Candidatus Bathyarchaeota archaeon]MDH5688656.1 hypothetical protein [Candidatus Bathyarchaeota archaeon]
MSHRLSTYTSKRCVRSELGDIKVKPLCRPYSLRAAFRTIHRDAWMPYDTIEFFMGHKVREYVRVCNSRTWDGWRKIYKK